MVKPHRAGFAGTHVVPCLFKVLPDFFEKPLSRFKPLFFKLGFLLEIGGFTLKPEHFPFQVVLFFLQFPDSAPHVPLFCFEAVCQLRQAFELPFKGLYIHLSFLNPVSAIKIYFATLGKPLFCFLQFQVHVNDLGLVPRKGSIEGVFFIHKGFGGVDFTAHIGFEHFVIVCEKHKFQILDFVAEGFITFSLSGLSFQ